MLKNWRKYFIAPRVTPSVLSQFIWRNSHIEIGSMFVYFQRFSTKNINFVTQLFHSKTGTS